MCLCLACVCEYVRRNTWTEGSGRNKNQQQIALAPGAKYKRHDKALSIWRCVHCTHIESKCRLLLLLINCSSVCVCVCFRVFVFWCVDLGDGQTKGGVGKGHCVPDTLEVSCVSDGSRRWFCCCGAGRCKIMCLTSTTIQQCRSEWMWWRSESPIPRASSSSASMLSVEIPQKEIH